MLRHVLRLIWNRRRANGLVVVEIGGAFVVTFVVLALSIDLWLKQQRPLGFDYEDVWAVELEVEWGEGAGRVASIRTLEDVIAALEALPGVEAVHAMQNAPFSRGRSGGYYGSSEADVFDTDQNRMTAGALQALGARLIDGRWFGTEDAGQAYTAVIVNRDFVARAFGPGESPLGRNIMHVPAEYRALVPQREYRIVGVIEDFRMQGDFFRWVPFAAIRYDFDNTPEQPLGDIVVKVQPGTNAAFEETIVETIKAIAPGWVVTVTPLERLRDVLRAETLAPIKAGATFGAFLLAMVVLGLIGVLWQDVVRRTQEIGVRRAVGASSAAVRRQIVLEMLAVASLGIAVGATIALQFPLLELVEQIDWSSTPPAIFLASVMIFALAAMSALYPSWLVSRRDPADALRYE